MQRMAAAVKLRCRKGADVKVWSAPTGQEAKGPWRGRPPWLGRSASVHEPVLTVVSAEAS